MPFLHLPVQSGSDRILAAMNRRHSRDDYLRIVDAMRRSRPDIAFSSDFIVGFPGETDADFAATLSLVETVGFASAYSFKYSPRPGTPGAGLAQQVPEDIKSERLAVLQELTGRQQKDFNRSCVGRSMEVLLERRGSKPGQLAGRSPYLQAIQVEASEEMIGQIANVAIVATGTWSLFGEIVETREVVA